MKKSIILRVITVLIVLCFSILTLTLTYFFNVDIETREPEELLEDCEINAYEYKERNVFTITKKEVKENSNMKYILYFHGGSYVAEATENHWNFLENIVKDTGYTVIMPDYPLTPKYNYKDVYNMIDALYKEII